MATITRNDFANRLRERVGLTKILEKNARMGRNPKTGASAVISARRVVSFRPSTEFRERVAGNK